MIEVKTIQKGRKTEDWIRKISRGDISDELSKYGQMGVDALASATSVESGVAAHSWGYRIKKYRKTIALEWYNTDRIDGTGPPLVILLQYGHATGTGGYVQGRDFINPAIKPVFDRIENDLWKKVTNG